MNVMKPPFRDVALPPSAPAGSQGRFCMKVTYDSPPWPEPRFFDDPDDAVDALEALYRASTDHLISRFMTFAGGQRPEGRVRAYYPYVAASIDTYPSLDSRLSFGTLSEPGRYSTTVTRPDLYREYLRQQLSLIVANHQIRLEVGLSETPIPVHFAFPVGAHVEADVTGSLNVWLRDFFDVPDLSTIDDAIVNAANIVSRSGEKPLSYFTAQRIDYSLQRLAHYTATQPDHFQNFVVFTNYQFYVDAFMARARALMEDGSEDYDAYVEPGNVVHLNARLGGGVTGTPPSRMPQMPAYHLKRAGHAGLTLVNIGVGPANAKTITDHIAVLRPHAWLMLGHCAGLRGSQRLGDYVLAHAYVREDKVLDSDLPVWVPVPALAEVQVALEDAVRETTSLAGYEVKTVMRTGTVVSIDNRNWELRTISEISERFALSRAIALDMESATIAANGYRFRVPYGTLLCVSDKPLHGELKLPGMASAFYRTQVEQHLEIGLRTMAKLAAIPPQQLHSRKLRSFSEVAFQ
jgi:AMP nucleosidase